MKIHVEVEGLKELQKSLQELSGNLQNMQKFWHQIGEYMKKRTINECFEKEKSPEGTPWKPLSQSRVKQRMKRHKTGNMKILQDTGELRRSISYRAFNKYVIIGSNLKYARIHQFGGTMLWRRYGTYKHTYSERKQKWRHYLYQRFYHIPARPYLGVTQADKQYIIRAFEIYVKRHPIA